MTAAQEYKAAVAALGRALRACLERCQVGRRVSRGRAIRLAVALSDVERARVRCQWAFTLGTEAPFDATTVALLTSTLDQVQAAVREHGPRLGVRLPSSKGQP